MPLVSGGLPAASARHLASATDTAQARATGAAAVRLLLDGETDFSPVIRRRSDTPYDWEMQAAALETVAGPERRVPADFLSATATASARPAGRTWRR